MREAARRRTFAIISHPDAGKTTLTEKFLLYAGARAARRRRQGPRRAAVGDVGLDGARAPARHLDQLDRAAVPVPRPRHQPARHARPPRLLRGHLPGPRRRRRRRDGARHGEGHRVADAEAVRGLPSPAPARAHVPQQVRPPGPRAARAARRDRGPDRPAPDAGDVARRHRRRPARRRSTAAAASTSASPAPTAARRSRPRSSCRPTWRPPRRARPGRRPRTRSACSTPSAPTSTASRSSPATRRRCSSARR